MKKFISLCTAIGILASATSAYALPTVTKSEPTVFTMTFDDMTTNGDPYAVMFNEATVTVRQLDANVKNKVLEIKKKAPIATVDFAFSDTADKMGFAFNLMVEDFSTERRIQVTDVAGTDSTALIITTDGTLQATDGRTLGNIKAGEWNNFEVLARATAGRFEVYRNGKRILSNALMPNSTSFGQFKRLRFWSDGGGYDSKMYVDDIHIYKGKNPLGNKNLTASFSSDVTEEAVEEVVCDETGISQNTDFEDGTVGGYPTTMWQTMYTDQKEYPGNLSHIATFPDESGNADNKVLIMKKSENNYTPPGIDFGVDIANAHYAHVEFKVYVEENKANAGLTFLFRSDNPSWNNIIQFNTNGVWTVGNKVTGEFNLNEWHEVHVLVDCWEMSYASVELDGEVIAQDIPWPDRKATSPGVLRLEQPSKGSYESQFYVDDLKIYNGEQRRTAEELNSATEGVEFSKLITPQNQVESWLAQSVSMITLSDKVTVNAERKTLPVSAREIDDTVYLPAEFVMQAFGGTASYDAESGTITANANGTAAVYTADSAEYTLNGTAKRLSAPAKVIEGTAMLPAEAFSDTLPNVKLTVSDDFCLVVLDAQNQSFLKEQLEDIFDYTMYYRPKAAEVKQAFEDNQTAGVHPRVLVTQDEFDRLRETIQTDPTAKAWYEELLVQAETKIEQELPPYIPMEEMKADSSGSLQGTYLTQARTLIDRAILMCMLYKLNGDERYMEWLGKEIDVWTALDTMFPSNSMLLCVAEAACGISIAYDWGYDYWSPERRKAMEDLMVDHAFWMFEGGYDSSIGFSTQWPTNENNTNLVTAGGSGVTALAFMEVAPERALKIFENACLSIENGLITYVPSGATLEGPSYWDYQTTYLTWMMMTAINCLGTDYGYVTENPFLKLGSRYYSYMQTRQGVNNVADAGGENQQSSEVLWLAKIYNDPELAKAKLDEKECNQMDLYPLDLLFYDPGFAAEEANLPLDLIYGDQALFHNEYHTQDSVYVSMHSGNNASLHGNIDAGTFLIDALGVRWAKELGHDSYSQTNYFQPKYRYQFYKLTTQGNNVLALNPTTDVGQVWNAVVNFSQFETSGRGGFAVVDMKNAYGSYVNSAQRGIKLDTDRSQVVVQDEVDLRGKNDVYWFMHTDTDATVVNNGKGVILKSNGKTCYLVLQCNNSSAKFTVEEETPLAGSGVNPAVWSLGKAKRLQIHISNASGKLTLGVRFIPMEDENVPEDLSQIEVAPSQPISKWTAEEGDYVARPLIQNITVDGKTIDGFSSRVTDYLIEYQHDTDPSYLPVIDATANEDTTVTIEQPENLDDTAVITVTSNKDASKIRVYQVQLALLPWTGTPEGRVERKPVSYEASSDPAPLTTGIANAFDGDPNTYFYNGNSGEYFTVDLGEITHVDVVSVRNHVGNTRRAFYDIQVSTDGKKWTTVFADGSSGKSADYENIDIGDQNIRYIKFIGRGHSNGPQCSYNDIKFYGKNK